MVGLSVAAILLAVALVFGLLAWIRRDLRARGASPRAWWLVVACYLLAAIAWLVAIVAPLPITVAWLATIPAAVATIVPERLSRAFGGTERSRARRRSRPIAPATGHGHGPMARPIRMGSASMARPQPTASGGVVRRRTGPSTAAHVPAPRPASAPAPVTPQAPAVVHAPGRHRWHSGDLRLAVELLEDACRMPDLDDAARARIEARLDRLDRFRDRSTVELLELVRADVHAHLTGAATGDPSEATRPARITLLLDELDPVSPQTASGARGPGSG
jgi:hypothetical protein